MNFASPVLMSLGSGANSAAVLIVSLLTSFAIASLVYFGLRALHRKRHPEKDDIRETNRQRREREKLKRETTKKVQAAISGEKYEEAAPNGKRSGKYKKKKKKK